MGASGCVYKQEEKHLVRLEPRKKRDRPLQIGDIIVADLDGPEAWELNEALYEYGLCSVLSNGAGLFIPRRTIFIHAVLLNICGSSTSTRLNDVEYKHASRGNTDRFIRSCRQTWDARATDSER
jgi:hypothetical protein